ncbi:MAG TPA: TolC family protein [Kofleriaceae bacterium]|nr:TolC family protein [Kofleriaceae bacterium]
MRAHADEQVAVRPLFSDPAQLAAWLAEHDLQIESARAKREAALATSEQAGVLPNPQISATVGGFVFGRTNPDVPRLGLNQTTNISVGVSELIELGKRGPRKHSASLRVDEAGELATAALGSRLGEAITILGKLAYVTSRRAAMAANLESARKQQALEQVRRDHADLSGAEYSRIELDTQQLELQLGRADADVATAIASCAALMHAPCSTEGISEPASLDAGAPLPPQLPDTAPAIGAAIEARATRLAAKLEVQALDSDATLAEHRAIPDLTLGVGYTYDNLTVAGNQQQTGLVSLSFPLPVFDRGNHDAAALRATARSQIADDEASANVAHGEIEALRAQRRTLEATVATLETSAVPKSAQIVEQTRRAFDLGQAGLAELLLAERAHRELLLELLDTRFDLFNVRAQLRQALGLDDQAARAVRRPS